jgi:hypothetical protein
MERKEILPFWADAGFEKDFGVFRGRLDFSGSDFATISRRAMVQANLCLRRRRRERRVSRDASGAGDTLIVDRRRHDRVCA